MSSLIQSVKLLRASVLLSWPVTVLAAGNTLGAALGAVTVADWVALVILSFIGGLAALLYRVQKNLEAVARAAHGDVADADDLQLISWRWFGLCHMIGSMFVGAVTFFVCNGMEITPFYEAPIILLASWSGAKLADKAANGVSDEFLSRLRGLLSPRAKEGA